MNDINVKEIMREPEPLFIMKKGPDKQAAAERLAATDKMFEEWFGEINKTNTRCIPTKLYELYEQAATILCMIRYEEKAIVTKR